MLGLYIHIPFCVKKCAYCDFYSIENHSYIELYVNSLIKEINSRPSFELDTIYIGGGTPSVLDIKSITKILDAVHQRHNIADNCEITMEVNPGTCDYDYLKALYDLGINRLSVGVQSFNDDELKLLGRVHDSLQAQDVLVWARKTGFDNISIDLISSLPNQKVQGYEFSLKKAMEFFPEHVSLYVLKLEPGTPLFEKYTKPEDQDVVFLEKTVGFLTKNNYIHYEISNYAREIKYQSRHNMKYWEYGEYLGFGCGAHSFCQNKRWANVKDVEKYIKGECIEFEETLTFEQIQMEKRFLGLRTSQGACLGLFKDKKMQPLINQGLMEICDNRVVLTEKGFLMYDSVCAEVC